MSKEEHHHHKEHSEHHEHHEEHKHHDDHKEHKEHESRKHYEKYEEKGHHDSDKKRGGTEMESYEGKGEGYKMDGFHLKKRDLWLVAGGALGALAALGLGKLSGKVRPAAVGAVREGYAFKEWLAAKAEKTKEDMEDIVAEGVHQYHSGLSATADAVKREKSILEKIEKMVEEKLAKMKTEQGEG